MANLVFNIAKGRVAELYNRVQTNDPANSVLQILILATTGLEADSTLLDKATVSALVSGTTNEVTNTNYARKTLTDSDLAALSVDNTNDWMLLDLPDQTWTSVAAGDGWSKLVVAYRSDSTTSTDSTTIPLTMHDFTATPNGTNIVATIIGFYKAI